MREIARGDESAFDFMWSFWCFQHVLDDLVDKDSQVQGADVARELCSFVITLSTNTFYLTHKSSLLPLLVLACDRWVQGDALAKSPDPKVRLASRVVACGDIDLFSMVAFLVGGWDHMQAMAPQIRRYDL